MIRGAHGHQQLAPREAHSELLVVGHATFSAGQGRRRAGASSASQRSTNSPLPDHDVEVGPSGVLSNLGQLDVGARGRQEGGPRRPEVEIGGVPGREGDGVGVPHIHTVEDSCEAISLGDLEGSLEPRWSHVDGDDDLVGIHALASAEPRPGIGLHKDFRTIALES